MLLNKKSRQKIQKRLYWKLQNFRIFHLKLRINKYDSPILFLAELSALTLGLVNTASEQSIIAQLAIAMPVGKIGTAWFDSYFSQVMNRLRCRFAKIRFLYAIYFECLLGGLFWQLEHSSIKQLLQSHGLNFSYLRSKRSTVSLDGWLIFSS